MLQSAHERSKRPRSIIAGPYGHPFHAILVTIPIGAWIAAFVFDLVAIFGDDPAVYARGAALLTLIGVIGALLAGLVGFLDLSQLESGTRVRRLALIHMAFNLGAIVVFAISLAIRAGDLDMVNGIAVTLSVIGLIAIGISGTLGGELAYRFGVRVADEATQGAGFTARER
jgi:uncharacterized membrane protein